MRWSDEEYEQFQKQKGIKTVGDKPVKKAKYSNKHIWFDGICFDSIKEKDFYLSLKTLQKAGIIKGFCRQCSFLVIDGNETTRGTDYVADFVAFYTDGKVEIVDVKGFETEVFKIKHKAFKEKYPKLELKVIK